MKPGRVVAIVIAAVVALPALGLFVGGGVLAVGYATERDDDGYFDKTLERLSTATAAITAGDVDLRSDPGPPEWLLDLGDFSVRLQVTSVDESAELFIGIAQAVDVESYLSGVAHDEVRRVDADGDVRYRSRSGERAATPPGEQGFWVVSASGAGTQELIWEVEEGEWAAVLMNSDGSVGVLAEVTAGVRSGALLGIAIAMLAVGGVLGAVAVTVIVVAARRREVAPALPAPEVPAPAGVPVEEIPAAVAAERVVPAEPVSLEATLDEPLSQWMWLVKWFLAIPHFIILAFMWVAFFVLTVIAGFAILFTGSYPRGLFDFNLGVLRWTWRVLYYAATGGLGTDRYPPFSLEAVADYPATLDIAYPEQLSQGLVLVKWWLLAIPHYLVLGLLGWGFGWWWSDVGRFGGGFWGGGLLGLLVLIAVVILLFTAKYPQSLFDLIIGLNRWTFRVLAYAGLMTDRYPPFRLDQGGGELERTESTPNDSVDS